MKILVLGASGFIGGSVMRHLLAKGMDVEGTYFTRIPVGIPKDKVYKVNLLNRGEVDELFKGVDLVVQAAASTTGVADTIADPAVHVTDNAVMNSLILRATSKSKVKNLIFLSCSVMYQKEHEPFREVPVTELDDDIETEIYSNYFGVGWTKLYIEKMCDFFSRSYGISTHCVRHSNIYGPHDKFDLKRSHVIGALINKINDFQNAAVTVWGDGTEFRDYLYITDLVDAVERLLFEVNPGTSSIWNVSSGVRTHIHELVELIKAASGQDGIEVIFDPCRPTVRTGVVLDSGKFRQTFGWAPCIDLRTGLKKTVDWYKRHVLTQNI